MTPDHNSHTSHSRHATPKPSPDWKINLGYVALELDQVSPTLASRGGFSTAEESMEDIVVKIAELVGTLADEEADELSMKSAAK
jgi:hypothetical protein